MTFSLTHWSRKTRTFWANPVVTRDLRVRLRGSKSVWNQGAYLLLLCVLALAGYSSSLGSGGANGLSAVRVQQQLQGFYYFIFMTLAALISLIAPALTAVSITTERQMLSLDLLTTSPLSAAELLVGKMISSVAFLLLLLALSLPASALCVILGGATLGDVVRVYLLLAIDGFLLAAIGLAVSCAARASMPALVWSYGAVALFLIVTFMLASVFGTMGGRGLGSGLASPAQALGVLNPFMAVVAGGQSFTLGSLHVPLWIGAAILAVLLIRLLVTAATIRMGRYGGNPVGSLRRQLLAGTAASVGLLAYSVLGRTSALFYGMSGGGGQSVALEVGLIVVFFCAALLLPSLFTPAAHDEDGPSGQEVSGWFTPRQAFGPEHAGALPFYALWLLTVGASAAAGIAFAGAWTSDLWPPLWLTVFYLSGVGWLFWSLARRAAVLVRGVSAARALGFVLFILLAWLPIAVLGVMSNNNPEFHMESTPLAHLWIFYPLMKWDPRIWNDGSAPGILLGSGALCYALGALVCPFWRPVSLAGGKENARVRSAV